MWVQKHFWGQIFELYQGKDIPDAREFSTKMCNGRKSKNMLHWHNTYACAGCINMLLSMVLFDCYVLTLKRGFPKISPMFVPGFFLAIFWANKFDQIIF